MVHVDDSALLAVEFGSLEEAEFHEFVEIAGANVEAPVTGLLVGVLENSVVCPGSPLCLFVKIEEMQEHIIKE